ncbi:AHH domain-containing protein [Novosphingobium sp. 9]|uniref:AHH domain-containing protein n=1 Tax=Novosphingobium sp. 9 TaxID=2025349 RepID=UPI0021B64FDC|nr:AHH domain-containing protein [Novosphingobium sp. 9]
MGSIVSRTHLPFRSVNCRGRPDFDAGLQRHHLLPRQLLNRTVFGPMFAAMEGHRMRFEDFRRNGLLLPCHEQAALRSGLPLHRGPHRSYTQLVTERVGQIEVQWAISRRLDPERADVALRMRIDLLQRALRRYLLTHERRSLRLNRHDRLPGSAAFADLDAMVDMLWSATEWPQADPLASFVPQAMPIRASRAD